MKKIRTAVFVSACLALIPYSKADLVTQPIGRFGLGDLLQVAISPDRQWMASSGAGGAFLWNFQNGTVVHRLEGHHSSVAALCFSPDGAVMMSGGRDGVIRAWDVATGLEVRSFTGHSGEVTDLTFSPDGQSFVSAGDNTARVWSYNTGAMLKSVFVPGAFITHAVFVPDGNRLVTVDGSPANNVRLWDLATGQTIRSFGSQVLTMGFAAGGQLVTGGNDLAVQVWDIETGQVIRPLEGTTQIVQGFITSTNSSLVTAGCFDGRVITWDVSTGDVDHQFFAENLFSLVAIPGTNQILTATSDKLVRVKNSQSGDNLRVFAGHTTSTTLGVGFSPDGQNVVSGGVEVFTRVWNRTNEQQVLAFAGHGAGTEVATYSPDGTRILTTFGAPVFSAQLWNAETGLLAREFFGHTSWLLAAAFSPDGQRVVTGAQDGTARLWDVATGVHIRTFSSPGIWIRAVAISSNGMFLVSGGSDGIARLWNPANGQLLRTFELNAGSVKSVDFSSATGELLVAWEDGVLRTFDPATGESKLNTIAPAAFLEAAVFSPDGRFILGGEGWPFFTARLWDARTGEELRVFAGHTGPVDSVAFNATGTAILTGSDIVRLWSIADIAARLQVERKPNGLELRWHIGTLEHSTSLGGSWNSVTNAVSPLLIPIDQPSSFFRVRAEMVD